ncbi:MAG TPA: DUF4824 family protein [Candidatus Cryosericum sp.]|nr:DUF4824 family protein [Candidatus Cryosericum sp.]
MRRTGPLLALLLVVVVDAIVLAGVAWNRRGAPESSLVLTERELPIGFIDKEDTGLWLRLDLAGSSYRWLGAVDENLPEWSSPERLERLGFDVSVPVADPKAEVFYSKALPLQHYAVLEYEGDSWRRWLAAKERAIEDLRRKVERGEERPTEVQDARDRLEYARVRESRLFLIDVDRDPAELRRRYPDRSRHIVAGAIVGLALRKPWNPQTKKEGDPVLEAYVSELLVDEIHVPRSLRPHLDAVRRQDQARQEALRRGDEVAREEQDSPRGPRYSVTLSYGRRHEPWVTDVRPLESSSKAAPAE